MSVPEMRKLLGLKKTDSYWLVHKNFFKTEVIGGMMRIDLVSFEKWYANQVKYKKVDGEEPGKELREKSYSFKEAANILGIHDCDLYDIWKNEKLEYITVDFVRRIPVDIFEKWYADQDVYRKVTHIPTAEELENDYICLQDAADLLGISREKLAKIARSEEIGRLLDSTICNNKRWITRKSFQLFLNAQNVYYILDDGDEQEKDTVSLEIKEYISRQEAAELAGVSVSTVTKWMQSGEFQCVGAGKVLRVHRQQFLNWLNEHREGVI
jgi:transposase